MLFALAYYFALYSGVAAQVARSNTVARHFTQTPRCGKIEDLLRPPSRFHQYRGKERKARSVSIGMPAAWYPGAVTQAAGECKAW